MNLNKTEEQINDELIEVIDVSVPKYNVTIKGFTHVLNRDELEKLKEEIENQTDCW